MAKTKVTGEYLKDSVVRFTAKAGENITKGNAVYISGISGELPVVSLADADDTAKMPAFGLAESTVSTNAEVEVTSFGTLANLDTSSYTLGDILYVDTTAGALTNDPAGLEATKLQNIGIVQRVHASNGSIKVGGAGRTNAVPNLDDGDIFIGDSNNKAVSSALSTEIESYLDGGTSTPTFASATVSGDLIVDTNRLVVDSINDRVGIALSTLPHRFSVGAANDDGIALYDGTNDLATLFRENTNQARFRLLDTGSIKVSLSSKPNDVNYINNGGSVGIGTDNPSSIAGFSKSVKLEDASSASYVVSGGADEAEFAISSSGGWFGTSTNVAQRFVTNNIERMRIDSSHGDLTLITSHSGGTFPFRVGYGSYASFTPTFTIDDNSNVRILAAGNDQKRQLRIDGTNGSGQTFGFITEADGENGRVSFKVGQGGATPTQQLMIHPDGGITFGTDTAAANALNDYEEGTWSTTFSSTSGATATWAEGYYTKIGNMVFANFAFTVNSQVNGNNYVVLYSGPFVTHQNNVTWTGYCTNYSQGDRRSGIVINNSSGNNTQWFVGWKSNSTASTTIRGVIVYQTT